jgi:hypothetical protein
MQWRRRIMRITVDKRGRLIDFMLSDLQIGMLQPFAMSCNQN